MLPIKNISYLLPMCCSFWEKCKNSQKTGLGCSTPLKLKLSWFCAISHQMTPFLICHKWSLFCKKIVTDSPLTLAFLLWFFFKLQSLCWTTTSESHDTGGQIKPTPVNADGNHGNWKHHPRGSSHQESQTCWQFEWCYTLQWCTYKWNH